MAQTIVCINNAGMIMQFWIEWVNDDGTQGWTQANSGDYPVDQRRSLDMDALNGQGENIPSGRLVRPHVQAVAGAPVSQETGISPIRQALALPFMMSQERASITVSRSSNHKLPSNFLKPFQCSHDTNGDMHS